MPTYVSAHTLCVIHVRAGVDIEAINYATKCTAKMKAKFSYCGEI